MFQEVLSKNYIKDFVDDYVRNISPEFKNIYTVEQVFEDLFTSNEMFYKNPWDEVEIGENFIWVNFTYSQYNFIYKKNMTDSKSPQLFLVDENNQEEIPVSFNYNLFNKLETMLRKCGIMPEEDTIESFLKS